MHQKALGSGMPREATPHGCAEFTMAFWPVHPVTKCSLIVFLPSHFYIVCCYKNSLSFLPRSKFLKFLHHHQHPKSKSTKYSLSLCFCSTHLFIYLFIFGMKKSYFTNIPQQAPGAALGSVSVMLAPKLPNSAFSISLSIRK